MHPDNVALFSETSDELQHMTVTKREVCRQSNINTKTKVVFNCYAQIELMFMQAEAPETVNCYVDL